MNITLLTNRDLASHLALSYLSKRLKGHNFSLFISERVGAEQKLPAELVELALFERELLNDGRPSFTQLAEQLGCQLQDFADCDNQINTPTGLGKILVSQPDLIICVRFGLILQQPVIDLPRYGVINLHSGSLPHYRGVMATFRAMLNEDVAVSSTLHYIDDSKIDNGPVIGIVSVPLKTEVSYTLNVLNLYYSGCENLISAVNQISRGDQLKQTEQTKEGCYYSFPSEEELSQFHVKGNKLFNRSEIDTINHLYDQFETNSESPAGLG